MKFGLQMWMADPAEFMEIARSADECGWDLIGVPDAPFIPEATGGSYPYTPDGARPFTPDTPVLDPWVAITAMAAVTKRIHFASAVIRLGIRKPLLEAKAVGSAAVLSNDRVGLGVGLAWMPEEFKYLNENIKTRGARVDEAIQVMRLLLGGGMVEFHGKFFNFDRLQMSPAPRKPVPIYVGGISKPALRRAARYGDGWISMFNSEEEIRALLADLNGYRKEFGREKNPFAVMVQSSTACTEEKVHRLEDLGVTYIIIPAMAVREVGVGIPGYIRDYAPLDAKLEAIKGYADKVISKCC